jgi:maltooligosyltrehalose synthase
LVAFARRWDSRVAVTLVPRLITSLQSDLDAPPLGDRAWGETTVVLPPDLKRREWQCVLTDLTELLR